MIFYHPKIQKSRLAPSDSTTQRRPAGVVKARWLSFIGSLSNLKLMHTYRQGGVLSSDQVSNSAVTCGGHNNGNRKKRRKLPSLNSRYNRRSAARSISCRLLCDILHQHWLHTLIRSCDQMREAKAILWMIVMCYRTPFSPQRINKYPATPFSTAPFFLLNIQLLTSLLFICKWQTSWCRNLPLIKARRSHSTDPKYSTADCMVTVVSDHRY